MPIISTCGWYSQYYNNETKSLSNGACTRTTVDSDFRIHLWFETPNCIFAIANMVMFFHIIFIIKKKVGDPERLRAHGRTDFTSVWECTLFTQLACQFNAKEYSKAFSKSNPGADTTVWNTDIYSITISASK